jgi:hypothetical protein
MGGAAPVTVGKATGLMPRAQPPVGLFSRLLWRLACDV